MNKLLMLDYRERRRRDGPGEMLPDNKGFLQTDGYGAYESFNNGRIRLLHCMTHIRRYFKQALDKDSPRTAYVLSQMQKLYAVKQTAREGAFSAEQRHALRQKESVPVMEELSM